jgi:hypothetical protein
VSEGGREGGREGGKERKVSYVSWDGLVFRHSSHPSFPLSLFPPILRDDDAGREGGRERRREGRRIPRGGSRSCWAGRCRKR